MKVGMVFECGPQGADKAVWTHLAAALRSGIEISAVTPRLARLAGALVVYLERDAQFLQSEIATMARSTMLHVRVDDEVKAQASAALAAMGLSVSDAVRILLQRVVNDQAFPLELKVPNAQTRTAMEEARAVMRARGARFDSADALIDDLEEARRR